VNQTAVATTVASFTVSALGLCSASRMDRARICLIALLFGIACERGRAIGQPCDRGDACESGVCTIGLYSDAICTQRCRGEGRGTCPGGWSCAGTAKRVASPRASEAPSICVPDKAEPTDPTDVAAKAGPRFDNKP
jgi:hypothetical protein